MMLAAFFLSVVIIPFVASAQTGPSTQADELVILQGTGTTPSSTAGQYQENIQMVPLTSLPTDVTVDLEVFAASDTNTALQTISVPLPAGTGATSQLVDSLAPGSYAAAAYSGTTKVSATTYFLISSTIATNTVTNPMVIVQGVSTATSATAGQFKETFNVIPLMPLASAATATLDIFSPNDLTTPLKSTTVSIPASSSAAISETIDGLSAGSYAALVYSGSTKISATAYFLVSTAVSAQYPIDLETTTQSVSTTNGQYQENFKLIPLSPVTTATSFNLDIFKANDTSTPLSNTVVQVPVGSTVTSQLVDNLAPGVYAASLYIGGTKESATTFFVILNTNATVDVVSISYPPASQVIGSTTAKIVGNVKTTIAIPVKLSYVWGLVASPMGNETQLINLTMVQPTATTPITLSFTNLTPATSYQFAIKNLILNTVSVPLQFTTLNANGTPVSGASTPLVYGGALFPYAPNAALGGSVTAQAVAFQDNTPATGIVPVCGRTALVPGFPNSQNMCGYNDFLQLISNVLHYAIVILGPIIACIILYSGAMIIWLSGSSDPTGQMKKDIKKHGMRLLQVLVGILIILLAWVIVATILRELGVKANYSFLDLLS